MQAGVAITTRNRPKLLATCRAAWQRFSPPGFSVLVVDDASEVAAPGAAFRFSENVGIARAKNKCIELLMDAGCEHLFLSDDDCWPVAPGWAERFIADREPHLMLLWGASRRLTRTPHYETHSHPRGAMLYVERRVVEKIGGMRPEFGVWGSEHVEWSRRIHEAGFTAHEYQALTGSTAWFHCEDWARPGESFAELATRRARSTTVDRKRRTSWRIRQGLLEKFAGSTDFVPYREGEG